MSEETLALILPVSVVCMMLVVFYMIAYLLKRHSLTLLYAQNGRDYRFVCELLRLYGDKNVLIKSPCLLKKYGDVPPRADAVIVGGGGVLILTVVDEPGQFSTPASGSWSVWQADEMKRLPNAFLPGRQYTSVLSGLLVKCGLSCPIVSAVVLTDDHATIDSLHEANVITAGDLIPYVKNFCRRRALGRGGQEKLKKAIKQHHEQCLRQLSTAMSARSSSVFANTGEFPTVNEETAPKTAAVDAPVEEMPAEETSVEKAAPVEEISVEEAPAEETADSSPAWNLLFEAEAEAAEETVSEEKTAESDIPSETTAEFEVESAPEEAEAPKAADETLDETVDAPESGATEEDEQAFKTLFNWLTGKDEE